MLSRLVTTLVVAGLLFGRIHAAADEKASPPFKITTKRINDTVTVKEADKQTVFIVNSPTGIGQAIIERTAKKWPACVMVQLHLKGLESFRAANGKTTLAAAVASSDAQPSVRMWMDDKENLPLDAANPFWMTIRPIDGAGKPTNRLPLQHGYFEISLPPAFFAHNPKSITLNWIDFYRN